VSDDSFNCSVPLGLRVTHAVADSAHGMNEALPERARRLSGAGTAHKLDYVGDSLEALIPHVIENHGPGKYPAG